MHPDASWPRLADRAAPPDSISSTGIGAKPYPSSPLDLSNPAGRNSTALRCSVPPLISRPPRGETSASRDDPPARKAETIAALDPATLAIFPPLQIRAALSPD